MNTPIKNDGLQKKYLNNANVMVHCFGFLIIIANHTPSSWNVVLVSMDVSSDIQIMFFVAVMLMLWNPQEATWETTRANTSFLHIQKTCRK